jgi:patatin-like phospholipase/acyl hydrolase
LRACDCRLPGEEFLKTCKELFRPRYNPENLDELLEEYCGNRTLSEALTNVIIPSFDIERQSPVFFSSWEVLSYSLSFSYSSDTLVLPVRP